MTRSRVGTFYYRDGDEIGECRIRMIEGEACETLEPLSFRDMTPEELGEPPKCKDKRHNCRKPVLERWLGVRWIGRPFPRRFVWNPYQMELEKLDLPGCGCIARLKRITEGIRLAFGPLVRTRSLSR
jgi:hypothetical protein